MDCVCKQSDLDVSYVKRRPFYEPRLSESVYAGLVIILCLITSYPTAILTRDTTNEF